MNGGIAEGTLISGKFFRVWMDVKAALTGKDRKAILNSCRLWRRCGCRYLQKKPLSNHSEDITAQQQTMLKAQHNLIKQIMTK